VGDILERISNAIKGVPNLKFQGAQELRETLINDDAFFHSVGDAFDPTTAEKIKLVKQHGLLCLDELEKCAPPELLEKIREHRDNDTLRGMAINCNGTDKISVFNYNTYLRDVKNKDRDVHKTIKKFDKKYDEGFRYYTNYSGSSEVTFKIDKKGLNVPNECGAAIGEKFVCGKIPPKNILGVVIPDNDSYKYNSPEKIEEIRKKIVNLFTDADWAINFYSGKTGKVIASNKKSVKDKTQKEFVKEA
jgi:hypothetical protein